jgi:heterodisulfide reductase subunit A-like polyferredoxin
MTIEEHPERSPQPNVQAGDRAANVVTFALAGIGVAGVAEAFIDISKNINPATALGVGAMALVGSAAMYAANHRDRGDNNAQ